MKFYLKIILLVFLSIELTNNYTNALPNIIVTAQDDEFKDASNDEFSDAGDEFSDVSEDEFSDAGDEFSDAGDEFSDVGDEFSNADDEFSDSGDEFSDVGSATTHTGCSANHASCPGSKHKEAFHWTLIILFFTLLAGIFVRFEKTRKLRGVFLLASLFVIGFYKAACTGCPIVGLQNFVLYIAGYEVVWQDLVWFPAIIVITYFFGKVWCGWICHLGALQEFLYMKGKFAIWQTLRAQKILRVSRYILLGALIIQLVIMGTKYWCRIDPFVNIFDFRSFYGAVTASTSFDFEWILIITLVFLILVSSVLTYRPFCRSMCPVGLLLGLIAKIPGASVIGIKGDCAGCKKCDSACDINAIIRVPELKHSILENQECIACGDCIDSCNKNGLGFLRKNKNNNDKVYCKNECSISNKSAAK